MALLDALMALAWGTANVLLAHMAWRLALALRPDGPFSDRILDALVVGLTTITTGTIFLGMIGQLSGTLLLLTVAALSGVGEWLTRWAVTKQSQLVPAADSRADATVLPLGPPDGRAERGPADRLGLLWGVLLVWLIAHMIVDGLLKFPTDWDCLMYHIPMVDEWLQARSLYAPDSSYWWSPGNSEVIGLWCVAPFSGDFLIALNNLPVMVLWVASTLSVARSLGMSNAGSHLTALAVVAVHTSFHETDDASNDLLLVAAFTAAVAYLLRHLRTPRTTEIVLGGLSLGLLAGVKYFSVGYVALVFGAWGAVALLQGRRWAACRDMALLLATIVPCGAYWYMRNLIVSGSPIYPMGLSGASPAVGYPNVWTTSLWGNPDPSRWSLVLPSLWSVTGPVHVIALIATPAVVVGLVGSILWRRGSNFSTHERWCWPLIAALLSGCGVLLLITPFAVEDQPGTLNHLRWAYTPLRYGLPFLSLAVVGPAHWIDALVQSAIRVGKENSRLKLAQKTRWLAPLAALVVVAVSGGMIVWQMVLRLRHAAIELQVADSLLLAVNLSLLAIIWKLLSGNRFVRHLRRPAIAIPFGMLVVAGIVASLSLRWHAGFDRHYDQFFLTTMFTDLARDHPAVNRVCVLDLRHYAFFGSSRQRHVCRPRYLASLEELYAYLEERRIRYVATHNGRDLKFDLYHDVPRWLDSAAERFPPLLRGGTQTVFAYDAGARPAGNRRANQHPSSPTR